MTRYNVNIKMEAENKEILKEKLEAFQILDQLLTDDELIVMAETLLEKPKILEILRPVLFSENELSLAEVLKKVPSIYKVVKKASDE